MKLPPFRWVLVAYGCLSGFISLAGVFLIRHFYFKQVFAALNQMGLSQQHAIVQFTLSQNRLMDAYLALLFLFSLVFSLGVGFVLAKVVLVPLVGMQTSLKKIAEGSPAVRLQSRNQGFFRDLCESFNVALERLDAFPRKNPPKFQGQHQKRDL